MALMAVEWLCGCCRGGGERKGKDPRGDARRIGEETKRGRSRCCVAEGPLRVPRFPGVRGGETPTPEDRDKEALHGAQGDGVPKQAKRMGAPRPADALREKPVQHRCFRESKAPCPRPKPIALGTGFEESGAVRSGRGEPCS